MMEVIYGGRRTGRTTKLIQMAAEAEAKGEVSYIVCHSQVEARNITKRAKEMELNIRTPITHHELRGGAINGKIVKYLLIDNAEFLLSSLIGFEIKAITIEDKNATAERFGI